MTKSVGPATPNAHVPRNDGSDCHAIASVSDVGALTAAWTAAEADLPLEWEISGLVQSTVYDAYIAVVGPGAWPPRIREGDGWVAMAGLPARLDEVPVVLAIGEGQFHYQALNNLAIELRELAEATTG